MRRLCMVLLAVAVGGCGVPVDAEPRPLDVELETDVGAAVEGVGDLPEIAEVYLVSDEHLVPVTREVADGKPETVVLALLQGPIAAENSLALRTAIPPETEVLGVEVLDRVATVDLSNAFTLVGGDQEILAVAQIVATLSSLDGIDGVRFAIEGSPRPAPVAAGELADRPLVPGDFESLLVR